MNYKQLQYDFTTDDAMTTKPKIKNRILVDVLDDDLISCFVITEQEATHDSPSYSFFSKLKSKMVFILIWDRECVTNHPPIIIHVWINHSFEINCLRLTYKCYHKRYFFIPSWKISWIEFKHDVLINVLKMIVTCSTIVLQVQLKLYIFAHFLDPIGVLIDGLLYLCFKGVTPLLLNLSLYILSNLH